MDGTDNRSVVISPEHMIAALRQQLQRAMAGEAAALAAVNQLHAENEALKKAAEK